MAQSFFINQSTIGVDLNNGSATQLFALGQRVSGTQNSEWVYVQANTSIVGQMAVAFNSAFTCAMASGLDVVNGLQLGIAQTSISSQAFGWVAIRGENMTCVITGTCSLGNATCIWVGGSATPTGVLFLNSTNSGSCTVQGFQLAATASSSASAGVGLFNLTWPKAANPGQGG